MGQLLVLDLGRGLFLPLEEKRKEEKTILNLFGIVVGILVHLK